MRTINVFVVDDKNEVIQDNKYTLIKMLKDTEKLSSMLVIDADGDISLIRAAKDYSVNPFRYTVRRKILIPCWFKDEDE